MWLLGRLHCLHREPRREDAASLGSVRCCLQADGQTIRIQAGANGSIQGPCEAKWGYTTLSVADWDHDGLLDLVVNSIWGKVQWYRNIGQPGQPKLAAAQPVQVDWPAGRAAAETGLELVESGSA